MKKISSFFLISSMVLLVFGCSSVGLGFANHPVDCAMGVKWADCLPGTAGYENGGGQQTRALEAKRQFELMANQAKAIGAQCKLELDISELDPIRKKVELFRESFDTAVPFEIASNDSFPTDLERSAIAKWATIREACIKKVEANDTPPASVNPLQVVFLQKDRAFSKEASSRVGELIVSLYHQKMTYGEFAKKRYEITRDAAVAERQFREAALIADNERQAQAQQLAQQNFQNNLIAWSAYQQAVNARTPQTVHVDGTIRTQTSCTSQKLGNTVSTNCY